MSSIEAYKVVAGNMAVAGDDAAIGLSDIKGVKEAVGKASDIIGQRVKVTCHASGEKFLFCSRFYMVGAGPNSCCNIRRALSKFHLTQNGLNEDEKINRVLEKAWSYFLTDAETPVIGDWCRAIIVKYGDINSPIYSLER